MRLIDADEFKKQIAGMAIVHNYPADKANKMCELIDRQTTAFNLDKVVEQLEEYAHSEICNSINGCPYRDNGHMNCENCGAIGALKIVKSGGIEKEKGERE